MRYVSTRDNSPPVSAAEAIHVGMVPQGGLYVPESIPHLPLAELTKATYQDTALAILRPLLDDFSQADLRDCVSGAYTTSAFDAPSVVALEQLDTSLFVMELWHGPTAAFKDVALQIMPRFMAVAKRLLDQRTHTVILVATSGDTGTAALEGFRDCPGVSIVVFYPDKGVSEIQRLQMAATEGDNTFVVAVRGNFDDCQSGVKQIFGDSALRDRLAGEGFELSSANSINWGRLSPQIVYYVYAYHALVARNRIAWGDPIDFCVPTGNFGNILAAYYAKAMGLPVRRLICAANRNRVLADFFRQGVYDRNREFYRTMSPSMDILVSSNLERFLFEMTGRDAQSVRSWYADLAATGRFAVDSRTKQAMDAAMVSGWVDEERVLTTIGATFREFGYVLDTHTAVAVAVNEDIGDRAVPAVIDATASPYKFSGSVLRGLSGESEPDELRAIERLHAITKTPVHRAITELRTKPVRHDRVIAIDDMRRTVLELLGSKAPCA